VGKGFIRGRGLFGIEDRASGEPAAHRLLI